MLITPKILEVKVLKDYYIYLKFEDGKEKVYDMTQLVENNKFYERLKDRNYFIQVKPRSISIEWPNGEDVCPENLYNDSIEFSLFQQQVK